MMINAGFPFTRASTSGEEHRFIFKTVIAQDRLSQPRNESVVRVVGKRLHGFINGEVAARLV